MERLADEVAARSAPDQAARLGAIMRHARTAGALVFADTRSKGCTMARCVAWLTANLKNAGVGTVVTWPYKSAFAGLRFHPTKAVFWYGNLWAMVADPSRLAVFLKAKPRRPFVALQTEHKGHRVYEQARCHYKWFLRSVTQVWDFGFDFCSGTDSLWLPAMWVPQADVRPVSETALRPGANAAVLLGKDSPGRLRVIGACRAAGLKVCFKNNLGPKASAAALDSGKVGLMIPRQAGNLEVHRLSSLLAGFGVVVSAPVKDAVAMRVFGHVVDFVPEADIAARVKAYADHPREWLAKAVATRTWAEAQRWDFMLKDVTDKLSAASTPSSSSSLPLSSLSPQPRPTPERQRSGAEQRRDRRLTAKRVLALLSHR